MVALVAEQRKKLVRETLLVVVGHLPKVEIGKPIIVRYPRSMWLGCSVDFGGFANIHRPSIELLRKRYM